MADNVLIELNALRLNSQGLNPQDVLRDFIALGMLSRSGLARRNQP